MHVNIYRAIQARGELRAFIGMLYNPLKTGWCHRPGPTPLRRNEHTVRVTSTVHLSISSIKLVKGVSCMESHLGLYNKCLEALRDLTKRSDLLGKYCKYWKSNLSGKWFFSPNIFSRTTKKIWKGESSSNQCRHAPNHLRKFKWCLMFYNPVL